MTVADVILIQTMSESPETFLVNRRSDGHPLGMLAKRTDDQGELWTAFHEREPVGSFRLLDSAVQRLDDVDRAKALFTQIKTEVLLGRIIPS